MGRVNRGQIPGLPIPKLKQGEKEAETEKKKNEVNNSISRGKNATERGTDMGPPGPEKVMKKTFRKAM